MSFEFPLYISLIPVAIGLVIVMAGLVVLLRANSWVGVFIAAFGVIFIGAFGPMLFLDKVRVDSEGVFQSTGFWFSQTHKGFKFDNLERIRIVNEPDYKERTKEVWVADYKSGESIAIDPGDLWVMHGTEIIEFMNGEGLVVDQPGE